MTQTQGKHTQGPWKRVSEHVCTDRGGASIERTICSALIHHASLVATEQEIGEARANARLIAAAPELLEALKDLVRVKPTERNSPYIEAAVKAIAKAEANNG